MNTIFEALFILALDEEEGDIVESESKTLDTLLAGAILAELVLHSRLELRDQRIVVVDQTPTEHPILDICLYEILETTKARKLKYWLNTLAYNKVTEEIGHHLVEQGVLVRKKKCLLLAIPHGENPDGGVTTKSILKKRLREIALAGQEPLLTEKVLLAFLYHGDLIKLVFKHGERKPARKRVKKLIANDEEGSMLGETLDEIVMTACETRN
jgi:hypothetical protein